MVEYSAFNRFVPGSIPGQPIYIKQVQKNVKYEKNYSTPRGIRIPVTSVKGRCPRPLDDGGHVDIYHYNKLS
jgi:hypothetical protein